MPRTPHKSPLLPLAVLLAIGLLGAPAAGADVGETIILRCTHGQSLAGFGQSAYANALKELSADAEEYTNCASLIRQAQLEAAGGTGGSAGLGGAAGAEAVPLVATPAEQRSLARAASTKPPALNVAGQVVQPGVVHASIASALSSLPSPLLAVIAVLIACLLFVAGAALRNRRRGQRTD